MTNREGTADNSNYTHEAKSKCWWKAALYLHGIKARFSISEGYGYRSIMWQSERNRERERESNTTKAP